MHDNHTLRHGTIFDCKIIDLLYYYGLLLVLVIQLDNFSDSVYIAGVTKIEM